MKGVVLCLAADRVPLAGSTNTNDYPGSRGTGTGGLYRPKRRSQAKPGLAHAAFQTVRIGVALAPVPGRAKGSG